jgi:hypothetical protein
MFFLYPSFSPEEPEQSSADKHHDAHDDHEEMLFFHSG